jgi:hypothetical protein
MQIAVLSDEDGGRYEALCAEADGFTLFHSWKYRRLLLRLLGCRALYLGAEGASGLVAVLPLMARSGPYGVVYNSLPFFGSHGGVLGAQGEPETALWQAFRELVSGADTASANVVTNPFRSAAPPFPSDFTDTRIGQVTPIDGCADPDILRGRIVASARYDVRVAERNGISVAIENDAFASLEEMHRARMSSLGGQAKPHDFFTLVPEIFAAGHDYNLYVARREGAVVAALLVFYCGAAAEYFMPAVQPEHRSSQPTAALVFRAMQEAASRGYRLWNWGGTWPSQEGVMRFKRNWGAVDRPYSYHTVVANKALLRATAGELVAAYPGFYTVPFAQLVQQP